jgi:hypothetical protein
MEAHLQFQRFLFYSKLVVYLLFAEAIIIVSQTQLKVLKAWIVAVIMKLKTTALISPSSFFMGR